MYNLLNSFNFINISLLKKMFILFYGVGYSFQSKFIDRLKKEKTTDGGKQGSYFTLIKIQFKESVRWIRSGNLLQLHGCFDKTLEAKI